MKRKLLLSFSAGLLAGMLLMWAGLHLAAPQPSTLPATASAVSDASAPAPEKTEPASSATADSSVPAPEGTESASTGGEAPSNTAAPAGPSSPAAWAAGVTYQGGDRVLYQGKIYRAKWWTLGEEPGSADVWEDSGETPAPASVPSAPSAPQEPAAPAVRREGFRVVGYYPSWKPDALSKLRYDVLTHVVYAFAIPTAEGGLRPLENAETAERIIAEAHKNGVQVLLAVGGWSYNDVPLEPVFVSATETAEKRRAFRDAILEFCERYGFDGIDMDWEHPRVDGGSGAQYEALMLDLAGELHARGKVLTSAVLSGATPDGNVYYDAAAHSDRVLEAVDWIHVMAYDGGDGERHSSYAFAVDCAAYWRGTRGMPPDKVVLGMPFYGRPSWASYEDILAANAGAWNGDQASVNGMEASYNGMETIARKTRYARENLGGVMIWEVTQDTSDQDKSLMTAIKNALQ